MQSNLRDKVLRFKKKLFELWITEDDDLKDFIVASILIRNNKVLLIGHPGSGKTTLIRLIAKGLSKDIRYEEILGAVTGAPEKTLQKVLISTNITKLLIEGKEEYTIRPIVYAKIKFINEINRFSKGVQDSLLSLLEEGYIEYGGKIIKTPNYICFADMNPFRGDIDRALKSRFLGSCLIRLPQLTESKKILDNLLEIQRQKPGGDLVEFMPSILSFSELEEIWRDVESIALPEHIKIFTLMIINTFRVCKYDRLRIMPGYLRLPCIDCEYSNEPCSKVRFPPDERAVIGIILYAKAHAWLKGRNKVSHEDVLWAAPFVLAIHSELQPSAKGDFPNPWDFFKKTMAYISETKFGTADNPGVWMRGLAIACKILDCNTDNSLDPVIKQHYPHQDKFSLMRELEKIALGEFSRGDLVIRELYNYVQKTIKNKLLEIRQKLYAEFNKLASDPNVTYSSLEAFLNKVRGYPKEVSEDIIDKTIKMMDSFRLMLNLEVLKSEEDIRTFLRRIEIPEATIAEIINSNTTDLEYQDQKIRIRKVGRTLIITANTISVANQIKLMLNRLIYQT